MKVKKLSNKIITLIVLIFITLISCGNNVKANQIDFSMAYLQEIVKNYYNDKEINDALPADSPFKGQADATIDSIISQAWGNDALGFIEDFTTTYENTTGTETEKNKAALVSALSKIDQFSGVANNIVNFSINEQKITEDSGDTSNTENNDDSDNTTNTTAVNVDDIKQMLYDYYTSPEYANVNGGVDSSTAEQKAQSLVDKYGSQMVEAYNNAYNSSTLTNEDEKREYAFQQAIAVTQGEDPILDGDYTGESISGGNILGTIVDGIAGILIYIPKLVLMIIGALLLRIIGFAINGIDGLVNGIPLDQILFNKIELLKVNFFSSVDPNDANAQIIESIRENIAVWYVAIRNLAAVILAVMVLYVGIRMAISSVAEEKAKYKRMLTDWVVSLVLLFVLHYIMILIININDAIVSVLAAANENGKGAPTSIMDDLWVKSLTTVSFTEQIGYVALYFMLAIMIFVFFATYVKRMITIAFLIMISPIITITYSLDRMGDGKSQALNTWFKNFVYNILLQPFQCIIYLALVKTAIEAIDAANLSTVIIAIIMVFFMYEAEDIIKEIFHFEGKSVANTIAQAALVTSAIGLVSKAASGAKAVRGYAKSTPSQNNTTTPTQTGIQKPGAEPPGQQESGAGQPGGQQEPKTQQPEPQPEPQNNVEKDATGYSRQSGGARGAVLGIAKKAGKAAIKGAIKLPFAVAFGAMGLGTGNLSTGITAFQAGSGLTEGFLASREEKANLHNFAKDYNNIAQEYTSRGYDNNQIREHTKDLLNGDVSAKDWEKDYYDSIVKEMDRYIAQGLSADDAITQVEQNVAGIQGGYLGEATVEQRFKGKISDAVKNRRRHNYGSANVNQNSGDPNNQNGGNPNNQN